MTYVIEVSKDDETHHLTQDSISSLSFQHGARETPPMAYVSTHRRNRDLLPQSLEQIENHCKDCKPSSPMVCVERCEVWRVKNEIVEVSRIVREAGHFKTLLNAVKNARRLVVITALQQRPLSAKELQQRLMKGGYRHSRSTITNAYLKPLGEAGLIKEYGVRYRLTFYGRKMLETLHRLGYENTLPIHSCCYEETVLKELTHEPKTFDELTALVSPKSLSRILMRLRRKGLIAKKSGGDYVFYHRAKKRAAVGLLPTEIRVFEAIPDVGVSARTLSKSVGITLRRTYKYLRRLRTKKLVFTLRMKRTYELTPKGTEIAVALDEIAKLALQSLSTIAPLQRSS